MAKLPSPSSELRLLVSRFNFLDLGGIVVVVVVMVVVVEVVVVKVEGG
jgi:hypothetical protein